MGLFRSRFARIPTPDKDAARDIPYTLSQLASHLDTRVILQATSLTQRDELFVDAPPGVVCVNITDGTVWVKRSAATELPPVWGTVYTPLPLTPINLSLPSGFQNINNKPAMVLYNPASREWNFWGNIAKTSGANITAFDTFATLPGQVGLPTYQAWWDAAIEIQQSGSFASAAAHVGVFPWGPIIYYGPDCQFVSLDGIKLPASAEYY